MGLTLAASLLATLEATGAWAMAQSAERVSGARLVEPTRVSLNVPVEFVPPVPPIARLRSRPPLSLQSADTQPDSWWAPAASAILPGAGQFMLGQDRSLAYLAVEVYGWIRFAADHREAKNQQEAYEALAATVARAHLSEEKPRGDFAYYERMENFVESGVFDVSGDVGIQPETDDETFNGALWLRARATFWDDPAIPPPVESDAYLAAVGYYADRAIRPDFRWSWRDAQLEQDIFRRTIDRSNDAYRRSLQDLGIILANHVLSTVDAYVTLRIRRMGAGARRVGVAGSVAWSPDLGFGREDGRIR